MGLIETGIAAGLLLSGAAMALMATFRLMRFPDITVEGSFLTGAAIWAGLVRGGVDVNAAALLAALGGAACGATTALMHRVLGIDRFLSGILVTAACYSIALLGVGVPNAGLFSTPSTVVSGLDVSRAPLLAGIVFASALALLVYFFFKSRLGLRARAAAINPRLLANAVGRPTPYLVAGLAFANVLAALSGAAFARYQGFFDVGMGQGVLISALAALAIGEAVIGWTRLPLVWGAIAGALIGSVLYQIALGAALVAGAPTAATRLVSALLVLVFLALQFRRFSDADERAS